MGDPFGVIRHRHRLGEAARPRDHGAECRRQDVRRARHHEANPGFADRDFDEPRGREAEKVARLDPLARRQESVTFGKILARGAGALARTDFRHGTAMLQPLGGQDRVGAGRQALAGFDPGGGAWQHHRGVG